MDACPASSCFIDSGPVPHSRGKISYNTFSFQLKPYAYILSGNLAMGVRASTPLCDNNNNNNNNLLLLLLFSVERTCQNYLDYFESMTNFSPWRYLLMVIHTQGTVTALHSDNIGDSHCVGKNCVVGFPSIYA